MAAARRAKATSMLLEQVNALAPDRNKSSDGWIGDEAHASRKSDHNPNSKGVVQAQDFTHDPANGADSYKFAELLRTKKDPRIKNVISNYRIFAGNAGPNPWLWRKYTGSNPHSLHCHVSVMDTASLYDDASEWDLGQGGAFVPDMTASPIDLPRLRQGDKGYYVEMMQTCLRLPDRERDREFGKETKVAVQQFQRDHRLKDDGIVGPYTWKELLRPWAEEVELSDRTAPDRVG